MNRDSDAEARRHPAGPGGPGAGGPTPPADDRTRQIPRVEPGGPPVSRQQVAQPVPAGTGPHRAPQPGWHAAETQPIPAVLPEPGLDQAAEQAAEQTRVLRPTGGGGGGGGKSLLRASGSMAIATLISRITGFGWKILLALIIGFGVENDSFTVANNLPNSVFELLIGGVLTSVIVPVLVRAQKSDSDGGESYIQRLLTLSAVMLLVGTALAVVAAPVLVWLYVRDGGNANPELATAFAYLLLPQILFYGISALMSAILQAKQIFSPPAWAPVVNNLVVIGTICVYYALPGELTINPVRMTDAHLMTLGIGVTLGVVAQAFIQVPALRRTGFRFRWRWGWDPRLNEFGGLALWMLAYVGVSQIGLMVMSGVGTRAVVWSMYNYVWMLLQLPYGVIGFSVMTAILPRMSGAAADHDYPKVVSDLSLGNRLSTVTLLPISGVMSAIGLPLALALFSVGKSSGDAGQIGIALAVSAFGVLPYAITMMQMRVFYALKDARTPTLIMVVMTVVKVGLALLCGLIEDPEMVLYALVFINSFSFVVGWVVGEVWLRHRLGRLEGRVFLTTLGKTLLASVLGGLATWGVVLGVDALIPGEAGSGTGWLQLLAGTIVGFAITFGLMALLRVRELEPAIGKLNAMLGRR
ncbi:murein biosynthesis integral membrane protein MurJ [Saccharopolyspora sp. NPDC047091]|uniref:murein biosynthesis integral membrane protein MurJ n=1 Tax=Saccharopolyspora sp. NPDC047091 TaxID=3155924 RepID=UPI003405A8BD